MTPPVMTYLAPSSYAIISQADSLIDRLCSKEFDAEVHLASGYRLAVRIACEHAATRGLVQHLRSRPADVARVLARIDALAGEVIDAGWASPHEAALLALLAVVQASTPSQLFNAVSYACRAPNAPWVTRFVSELATPSSREPAFRVSSSAVSFADQSTSSSGPPLVWQTPGFWSNPSARASTFGGR